MICLSDTHNQHSGITLPEGDVLIHAGDATGGGTYDEVERFLGWFSAQPFAHRILIAGNHDWLFQESPDLVAMLLVEHPGVTYLQESGVVINGVYFWGSSWQPEFMSWAFNLPRRGVGIRRSGTGSPWTRMCLSPMVRPMGSRTPCLEARLWAARS